MLNILTNDNDVIVYTLEKILSYSRDKLYMFLAQSISWIASIIGLHEKLVIHIDNRKKQSEATLRGATPQAKATINHHDKSQQGEEKSATLHNSQGDSRLHNELGHIHPDRISQTQSTIHNISDLQISDSSIDQSAHIITQAELFIQKSRKDGKRLTSRNDPLSRTRSGKLLAKPLSKKQRNYLLSTPKATISHYLENRE
jgi:hypothetical protein